MPQVKNIKQKAGRRRNNEAPLIDVVTVKNDSNASEDKSKMALSPELRQAVLDMVADHKLLKSILITCTLTGLRPQKKNPPDSLVV